LYIEIDAKPISLGETIPKFTIQTPSLKFQISSSGKRLSFSKSECNIYLAYTLKQMKGIKDQLALLGAKR